LLASNKRRTQITKNVMNTLAFNWVNIVSPSSLRTQQQVEKNLLKIGCIWYINILPFFWGFRTNFYIWCCFLCIQVSWELWDKRNFKHLQFWPKSLVFKLEYYYIERSLLLKKRIKLFVNGSMHSTINKNLHLGGLIRGMGSWSFPYPINFLLS